MHIAGIAWFDVIKLFFQPPLSLKSLPASCIFIYKGHESKTHIVGTHNITCPPLFFHKKRVVTTRLLHVVLQVVCSNMGGRKLVNKNTEKV